jgi:isoleucyl-tRNA synthetase
MSAALALQKAMVATLRANALLTAVVSARIYDRVPANAPRPYVHLRQFQELDDSNDCSDAWEVNVDLDVWSETPGKPEASRAAMAIRDALHDQDLTLDEPYALVELRHRDTQIGDGGDGLLTRARLSFRALIERV